jgi:hypothetical protein
MRGFLTAKCRVTMSEFVASVQDHLLSVFHKMESFHGVLSPTLPMSFQF